MNGCRQLSLVKGSHRFVFRYASGQEAAVINAFADLAGDAGSGFDWFDAAVLSYQMGRRLELSLDQAQGRSDAQAAALTVGNTSGTGQVESLVASKRESPRRVPRI